MRMLQNVSSTASTDGAHPWPSGNSVNHLGPSGESLSTLSGPRRAQRQGAMPHPTKPSGAFWCFLSGHNVQIWVHFPSHGRPKFKHFIATAILLLAAELVGCRASWRSLAVGSSFLSPLLSPPHARHDSLLQTQSSANLDKVIDVPPPGVASSAEPTEVSSALPLFLQYVIGRFVVISPTLPIKCL